MSEHELTPGVIETLNDWWHEVVTPPEGSDYVPRGLWVTGERGIGTSHIARRAMRKCDRLLEWPLVIPQGGSRVEASRLVQAIKDTWQLEAGVRSHPTDDALFRESQDLGIQVEWWLEASPATLVDNLHRESYDGSFWKRHIWPWLEGRIKAGLPTIVATDMDPAKALGPYWPNLFVVLHAER